MYAYVVQSDNATEPDLVALLQVLADGRGLEGGGREGVGAVAVHEWCYNPHLAPRLAMRGAGCSTNSPPTAAGRAVEAPEPRRPRLLYHGRPRLRRA